MTELERFKLLFPKAEYNEEENCMEWYMKNRWWIWSVTGVYLAYRIFFSIYY